MSEDRPFTLPDAEWRARLTPTQYAVLREKGTERAFTGALWNHVARWPSFYAAAVREGVEEVADLSHGMRRVEVLCAQCGGHLGHVFPDGPHPTGLRYCINSASLRFEPA